MWANDIALVKMDMKVPSGVETPEIRSVFLPKQSETYFPAEDQQCVMKGWGCSRSGQSILSLHCFVF